MNDYLEVIPLGGVGEFGMNCCVLRSEERMVLIDAGMTFPRSDKGSSLGVNVVVPDIRFLLENQDSIEAIFLTHGHEDHIGAVAYIINEIPLPVYGSRIALGLVENRLREHGLLETADLRPLDPQEPISAGPFRIEAVPVTHSFPDSFAFGIECPAGRIVWTGDFKFDQTPYDGRTSDLHRLASYGERGVLALFSDSTNSAVPGLSPSEQAIQSPLRNYFREAPKKIIFSCFSSSIHRIQLVLDLARDFGRRVAPVGRSLVSNLHKASELGYLRIPEGVLTSTASLRRLPPQETVILASGSQGEPMSAMSRMAVDEMKGVKVEEDDIVILSARKIPGNEKRIAGMIDHFYRRGARVLDSDRAPVHASGHGYREDLKLMIDLVRPRHFTPIHGDYRQLKEHALLARQQGIASGNIHLIENGMILRLDRDGAQVSGVVPTGHRYIDEGYTGEVHEAVLRDRKSLAEDGFLIAILHMDRSEGQLLGEPELVSRGFISPDDSEDLMAAVGEEVLSVLEGTPKEEILDEELFSEILRKRLTKLLRRRTGKRPMVLPVILNI